MTSQTLREGELMLYRKLLAEDQYDEFRVRQDREF